MDNRAMIKSKERKKNAASYTVLHRAVVLLTYIYLALPMIIFLLGWCRLWIGIPLAGVCVWSLILCFRKRENYIELDWEITQADKWKLVVIGAVIFTWVALSGVGGYTWQNADHASRNEMLQILVDYKWPPNTGTRGFVYYVGSWLPAALVGKVSNLNDACTTLFLWVLLGVFLLYALICIWRRKIVLWPLMILVFFSGLDIIGSQMFTDKAFPILGSDHLEWWASYSLFKYQYTSNTSQLYWVFNQSVPIWLVVMLLFMDEPPRNMLWVSSLVAITSTLPFIGLLPIMIYYMFKRSEWYRPESVMNGWRMVLHNLGSVQNLAGGGSVLILSFLYLVGNESFTTIKVANADSDSGQAIHLAIGFPWLLILVGIAVMLLVGTLVLWTAKWEKEYILRNTLYAITAIFLTWSFFDKLWGDRIIGNDVFRLAYVTLFFLLEVGIYLYLLYRDVADKGLFNVVTISLIIIPFIVIGRSNDFCMRASIPGLFIVTLWCIEALGKKRVNLRIIILTLCLVIGAVSPIHEMRRSLINSCGDYKMETVGEERIFNAINFSGGLETFFWRYIARKTDD